MAKYLREVIYEKRISFGSVLGDSAHRVWGGIVREGGVKEDMVQGGKQVWRKGMVRGGRHGMGGRNDMREKHDTGGRHGTGDGAFSTGC